MRLPRSYHLFGLLCAALLWLANSNNPPTGNTGAPFNGHCNNCHSGNTNNYNGLITVSGMPTTVQPNIVYPLTITMEVTAGNPIRGGFQLVAVDGSNASVGLLTPANAQTGVDATGGRDYLEHRGTKTFGGNPISWDFSWKAPASASGNTIKFYFIGNFANNNGGTSGDFALADNETYAFAGPPPVTATISSTTNVLCNGGNTGSATVEPSGGNPPYTYHWSNNQSNQTAVNLVAGTYLVTVTASGGSGTATASATITQPTALVASASASGALTCTQTSVNVTASVTGGAGGYSYAWSNGDSGNPASYQVGGSQTVTVTDANGCQKVAAFTIQSNTTPPVAMAGSGTTLTCQQPTATLSGTGSSTGASFSYVWTTPDGNIVSGATTLAPTVNAAGTYTLQVTNTSNGCTATASTTVTSNIIPPTATATGGLLTCAITSVGLTVTTNAGQAAFMWSGPNFTSNLQNPTVTQAGTYTVTVTNTATGCTKTATATVTQNTTVPSVSATGGAISCTNPTLLLSVSTNAQQPAYLWSGPCLAPNSQTLPNPSVSCAGTYTVTLTNTVNGCTNTASATVTGNTTPPTASATPSGSLTCSTTSVQVAAGTNASPATFAWSGPGGLSATTQNITATLAGNYTVTITASANGCTATAVGVVVQNTTPPTVSIATPGSLNCNALSIQLNAQASSQGSDFTYLWTTANGNIVSGGTTLTPIVNAAGTYNLLITNTQTGCTAMASTTVTQVPPVVATIAGSTSVSCNGGVNGSATAAGGGGTGVYTYLWSNGAATATAANLSAGVYTVTISDANNCTATAAATISQPAVLAGNASATAQTTNGVNNGTATAAPTGGTAPYSYAWSNGGATATITGLAPGVYTVTVTDAAGCTAVQSVTVNSFNCSLTASTTTTNISCNGAANGTATAVLTGGTLPITYLWSTGATTAAISGLTAGNYTVSMTDANGCPAVSSATILEPAVLAANATATAVTAANTNDGTATAQPSGGTAPYTYLWSTGGVTPTITGLAPGNYAVTITDANACTAVQSVTVNAFNCTLVTSISTTSATCPESANGSATAVITGGSAPYTFEWSSGATTATAGSLLAGTYTVTVSDAANCVSTASATVVSLDTIAPGLSCPGNISLCGADIVTYPQPVASDNCMLTAIPVLISGQVSGTAFDDGVTTQVFRVTDVSGNSSTCSFTVTIFPVSDILIDSTQNDIGNGGIGSIHVSPVGGVGPYTFIWRKDGVFFSNDEDLTGLQAGIYTLTMIDVNGCQVSLSPITIDNIVATGDPLVQPSVRVWPNPANTGIWLKTNHLDVFSAEILGTQGQLVQTISAAELSDFISIDRLPAGIYYLKIVSTHGKTWLAKWVKGE